MKTTSVITTVQPQFSSGKKHCLLYSLPVRATSPFLSHSQPLQRACVRHARIGYLKEFDVYQYKHDTISAQQSSSKVYRLGTPNGRHRDLEERGAFFSKRSDAYVAQRAGPMFQDWLGPLPTAGYGRHMHTIPTSCLTVDL